MIIDKNRLAEGDEILVCECCGEEFLLLNSAKRHIESKGWAISKRCPSCRSKKRERVEYDDIHLQCAGCGEEFVFTGGEQFYYKKNDVKSQPRYCAKCREQRKKYFDANR